MATYDFANTILRSLQTQDELNMRKQQMGLEEARFEQQMGQQNRQFGLEQDRLNATLQQNQEMNKFRQFNASETFRKNFLSQYETKNEIPPTLTKQMPSTPDMIVSPEFGSQFNLPAGEYYSKNRLTNIKTATGIQHGQTMETQGATRNKIAQQNANANTLRASATAKKEARLSNKITDPDKLDATTKSLMGTIDAGFADANSGSFTSKQSQSNLVYDTNRLVGRTQITDVVNDVWTDMKKNKTSLRDALKRAKQAYILSPQQETVLDYYFSRRLPTGKMK